MFSKDLLRLNFHTINEAFLAAEETSKVSSKHSSPKLKPTIELCGSDFESVKNPDVTIYIKAVEHLSSLRF